MDDVVIEKCNLNHQFLFCDWNIRHYKSTFATAAVYVINPSMHIDALQNQGSSEKKS